MAIGYTSGQPSNLQAQLAQMQQIIANDMNKQRAALQNNGSSQSAAWIQARNDSYRQVNTATTSMNIVPPLEISQTGSGLVSSIDLSQLSSAAWEQVYTTGVFGDFDFQDPKEEKEVSRLFDDLKHTVADGRTPSSRLRRFFKQASEASVE